MSKTWAEILLFVCCVAQMFCLTASVTSASRMMFAFSRDRAIPGHQLWRQVSRTRIPYNAVLAIGVLAWALMIPTYWNNATGYLVGTSIAVIGLYIAFILPVILRFKQGDAFEHGAWSLGKHYKWIDLVSIVWVAIITILFLGPVTPAGIPWRSRLQLGRRELRAAHGRRRADSLRRLVAHLREELVQGARADGHRGGARGDGGEAGVRLRRSRRHAVRDHLDLPTHHVHEGAPVGAPSASQPIQAPPFWSIACPVTPRASGDSSHATVPATSPGCDIRAERDVAHRVPRCRRSDPPRRCARWRRRFQLPATSAWIGPRSPRRRRTPSPPCRDRGCRTRRHGLPSEQCRRLLEPGALAPDQRHGRSVAVESAGDRAPDSRASSCHHDVLRSHVYSRRSQFAGKTCRTGLDPAPRRSIDSTLRRARGAGGRSLTGRLYAEAESRPAWWTKAHRPGECMVRSL